MDNRVYSSSLNYDLVDALQAFREILRHATRDPVLSVYSEGNRKLYSITERQISLIMKAAETQVII